MRRLLAVVGALLAVACGKTRAFDPPAGSSWEDPTAENGFYETDWACRNECVVEGPRGKHAVRATPPSRILATIDAGLPDVLFIDPKCVAVATRTATNHGLEVCVSAEDGHVEPKVASGPSSAMVWTDRLFVADRDPNGASRVMFGGEALAGAEHDVRTLVGHRGDVFWIDASARVRRLRRSDVTTVARGSGFDSRFLAVDDAAFYVVRGGNVVRLSREDDAPKLLATATSPIRDVVLAGEWLYWTEEGEPRFACQPDGTSPECHARGRTLLHAAGTLRRVRVTSPFDIQLLASDVEDANGILVVHSFAYVSTREGVLRVPLPNRDGSAGTPTMLATETAAIGRPVMNPVAWTLLVPTRPPGFGASGIRLVALVP